MSLYKDFKTAGSEREWFFSVDIFRFLYCRISFQARPGLGQTVSAEDLLNVRDKKKR
jgi:hypothetical protein